MKAASFVLVAIIVLFSATSFAQEKSISYVQKGDQAPFSGYLLSPAAFAELKAGFDISEELFNARLEYELGKQAAKSKLKISNLELELKLKEREFKERSKIKEEHIKFLEAKLVEENTFWDEWKFDIGVGVGIAVTVGMFLLVNEVEAQADQ